MHVDLWSRAPGQTCLSLFGGLCSQTVPPSNYVYIELSARIDASPALGSLHGLYLCICMAKSKGYIQMSLISAHAHMYDDGHLTTNCPLRDADITLEGGIPQV